MQNEMKDEKLTVRWWSKQEAFRLKPRDDACLISLYTPGDATPVFVPLWKWFWQDSFHDVDVFSQSGRYYPMLGGQAKELFEFIKQVKDRKITTVNVHCDAGISRSAAVAKFTMEFYGDNSFPVSYSHYNSTVYKLLVRASERNADVPYEKWWSST